MKQFVLYKHGARTNAVLIIGIFDTIHEARTRLNVELEDYAKNASYDVEKWGLNTATVFDKENEALAFPRSLRCSLHITSVHY